MKYLRSIDGYKNLEIPLFASTIYNDRVVLYTTSNSNQEKLNFRMAKDTHLTVTTQHLPNPRVFIGDIPSEVSSEDITESLLKLDLFKDESLKPQLKVVRSITKPNNDHFSLILEVPSKSMVIFYGWGNSLPRLPIFPYRNLRQRESVLTVDVINT